MTLRVFAWKRQRLAQDPEAFDRLRADMRAFIAAGGAVYPNLVVAKLLLSGELQRLPPAAAGLEEFFQQRLQDQRLGADV